MGCHIAQGYGIAKPLAAHELIDWVGRARRQQNRIRATASRRTQD
jgi:EAL domain-containing protein (putative c-di-GMP-specific phosphodiesterase class I)